MNDDTPKARRKSRTSLASAKNKGTGPGASDLRRSDGTATQENVVNLTSLVIVLSDSGDEFPTLDLPRRQSSSTKLAHGSTQIAYDSNQTSIPTNAGPSTSRITYNPVPPEQPPPGTWGNPIPYVPKPRHVPTFASQIEPEASAAFPTLNNPSHGETSRKRPSSPAPLSRESTPIVNGRKSNGKARRVESPEPPEPKEGPLEQGLTTVIESPSRRLGPRWAVAPPNPPSVPRPKLPELYADVQSATTKPSDPITVTEPSSEPAMTVRASPLVIALNQEESSYPDLTIVPLPSGNLTMNSPYFEWNLGPIRSVSPMQVDARQDDLPFAIVRDTSAAPTIAPVNSSQIEVPEVEVEEAVEDVCHGVGEVDIGSRAPSSAPSIEEIAAEDFPSKFTYRPYVKESNILEFLRKRAAEGRRRVVEGAAQATIEEAALDSTPHGIVTMPRRTRQEWRRLVEIERETDIEAALDTDNSTPPLSSGPSSAIDTIDYGVSSILREGALAEPPDHLRGIARRNFNTRALDEWNRMYPTVTQNGSLHRLMFEDFITYTLVGEDEYEDEIKVVNNVDRQGQPPDFEFQYSNKMLYHPDVPDPELGQGCGCEGPCDPSSSTCSCVKRQQLYMYEIAIDGFAYDG